MKQSERVKEASRRALAKLSQMSKEELDQRLSARELGPVGQLLLETGTIHELLREKADSWAMGRYVTHVSVMRVQVSNVIPTGRYAADNDVRYALAAPYSSPWTTTGHLPVVTRVYASEDEKWAKAA
jgi:hypothetical protein